MLIFNLLIQKHHLWGQNLPKALSLLLSKCLTISCYIVERYYNGVIMDMMASQITSPTITYSTVYSGADQRKHQSSASLAFVRGIHQSLVNSPHKWPVTQEIFPFDDVIMGKTYSSIQHLHVNMNDVAVGPYLPMNSKNRSLLNINTFRQTCMSIKTLRLTNMLSADKVLLKTCW